MFAFLNIDFTTALRMFFRFQGEVAFSCSHLARLSKLFVLAILSAVTLTPVCVGADELLLGSYEFSGWSGPSLQVHYSIPSQSHKASPVVIIVPGAKRNAAQYRDEWDRLANANGFIALVVEASLHKFSSEYAYNLGGITNARGELLPEKTWLLSAIDPIFNDFRLRQGSVCKSYGLYGHSAGGCFAQVFALFKPDSLADRIVAANSAFFLMPNNEETFPFGLRGVPLPDFALRDWFRQRMVILLGDRDLQPRTHPLSDGVLARKQGPHVFARGLGFYHASLCEAFEQELELNWRLEVVSGVGHSNAHLAPFAVKYLIPDQTAESTLPQKVDR